MTEAYRPEMIQSAFINFLGSRLQPFWSLTSARLRLVARQQLSDDLIVLEFETNRAFRRQAFARFDDWHGGQHISLSIPIEGVYHQRHYSLVGFYNQPIALQQAIFDNNDHSLTKRANHSTLSTKNTVTIAIKPQGLVSNYLTQQVALGTIFDSGIPAGDFTFENNVPFINPGPTNSGSAAPILFIASGSGITPMLGLITQALANHHPVTLLYYHRQSSAQTPFLHYWQHLAALYDSFDCHIVSTTEPDSYLANSRYLTSETLLSLQLPLTNTAIFACGSSSLLTSLYKAADEIVLPSNQSLRYNIVVERFGTSISTLQSDVKKDVADIEPQMVYLRGRQQQFSSANTILIGAEQAGIRLTYGCRQGICQLCRCDKISGVVKNIETGKLSSNGAESIQTCINIAMTEVVLEI
ncbi:flavin reductase family protein [Psychrobacter sp. 1U2]|uniref:flavin reductase family protein n=1 Tax=Psychrobacter sp. 1U2 TaxID=3453577 RepID=UPI003F471B5F